MWARLQIDVSWSDLIAGVYACGLNFDHAGAQFQCAKQWNSADDAIVCSSVRSGFDLLLQAMKLPSGSEGRECD